MKTPEIAANSFAVSPKITADPEAVYVAADVAADWVVLMSEYSLVCSCLGFLIKSKKKNNSFSRYREYPLANSWQGKNLVF